LKQIAHRGAGILVACALVLGTGAAAQETSSITGTVTNAENKKPVADVVVTAQSPALPSEQIVVTDAKGQYTVENLPPGTYTLRFEGPQYRPFSRAGVAVRAGTPVRFDVQLAPDELQEEVIVTGSRIPRPEVATAAPVTVVGRNQIETAGRASIGDILQQLPAQGNATNTTVNNGGEGATRIDLRSLGAARTLVLVNGRRFVPGGTGANASVDLGTIPTQAIERIEVLKDGASAAYGSDAIAGVVNIITRKDFSGTELSAFGGLSSRGDTLQYDINFTTGLASDKGNLLLSGGFFSQAATLGSQARPFSYYDQAYDFGSRTIFTLGSGSPEYSRIQLVAADRAAGAPGNAAWQSVLAGTTGGNIIRDPAAPNGWRNMNTGAVTDAGGDLYNYQPVNYLVTPNQRVNLFATGGYKLAESVRLFAEATYTARQSQQLLAPEPLVLATEGLVVSADNVYNPFGRDFTRMNRRLTEFGGRDYRQDLATFQLTTGLEGTLAALNNWNWDVAVNYGRTQGLATNQGNLQRSKLQAALGPSMMINGVPTCVEEIPAAGTDPVVIDGCVPLDLFGPPGSITKEMAESVSYTGIDRADNSLFQATANASGQLFRLFNARDAVGMALGIEHRRQYGANIPNPLIARNDSTGNITQPTEGGFTVNEGYAELSVPLIGRFDGSSAAGDFLELNAAVRAFRYNTFGTGTTYKIGTRISPVQDITLRGTVSNAFRAPSVGELYAGTADSFPNATDPCSERANGSPADAVCDAQGVPQDLVDPSAQLRSQLGGNRNLTPETAQTFTAGIVIQPRVLPEFSATVDYWNIDISNTISAYGADVILAQCYGQGLVNGQPPAICGNIQRDADGFVNRISDIAQNVGRNQTSGIDFGLRYEPQTAFGRVGLRADVTYLNNYDLTTAAGEIIRARNNYDLSLVLPDWRGLFGLSWANGPLNAGVNVNWLNSWRECENNACDISNEDEQAGTAPFVRSRRVDSYFRTDLNLGLNLETGGSGKTNFAVGVTNLFDVQPVYIANGFTAGSDPTMYDYIGRYFFARLTHSFY
jgi:outer membrane receptor protein involved in Fe transport